MRYKVFDTELEAEINGWPMEWRESISIVEASTEKSADAPKDSVCKENHQSNDDSSTTIPANPETQCILQETRAKKHMHQDANNNTISTMEAQLHKLVNVVNDATDVAAKK